jgi:hypothetical protein
MWDEQVSKRKQVVSALRAQGAASHRAQGASAQGAQGAHSDRVPACAHGCVQEVNSDERMAVAHEMMCAPLDSLLDLLYPDLFALHDLGACTMTLSCS